METSSSSSSDEEDYEDADDEEWKVWNSSFIEENFWPDSNVSTFLLKFS